ncbi:MAG: toll/interleukin-1 receptor domain-containing protein [Chloroflexi bacterium]|nr:toll/interleukin-1 receptor domain-containing protein [Chloroflexota bacterium]
MNYEDDDLFAIEDDDEHIEAYCVRCRETVIMENPMPVWTRKGMPAMRGECPSCGGTVFRMGKTSAHDPNNRPAAVKVANNTRAKLSQDTVYIACAGADLPFAEQLADDLQKAGIANWIHGSEGEDVNWAGGVHPALKECARMVFVLSPQSAAEDTITAAWRFFREKRKPVVIALVDQAPPPDELRRSQRFDFSSGDYKITFRQMIQALNQ